MRLYLFRRGEVGRSDLLYGQYDNPLNEQGERRSNAIARFVSELDVDAIYTSDLGRAAEAGRRVSIIEYGETKTRVALLNADLAACQSGTIR